MKVIKINAYDVFKDNNAGFIFGLEEANNNISYIEWFKTEKERNEIIKKYNMEVIN